MAKKEPEKRPKQQELKGMPPKGEVEKEAELFVSCWEDFRTSVSNYRNAVKRITEFAEKHSGINRLTVADSLGVKRSIRFGRKSGVTVRIGKAKKFE